ncbi:MAG: DNA methyltransferase [Planctomycetes bacterium GWF2_41_51]|nr:MAG: DNA methyltransferase [Planctomycetes bacterium GWF2_41_51]HBG27616.1 SAM-dependent methyltransferase [Phycisphaerales bacterium]
MNIAQIESNLQKLKQSFSKETFIYDLLLSYGLPKASIARLKNGNLNLSKKNDEIIWKKKLLFRVVQDADLHETIDNLRNDSNLLRHSPRFVVVTNYETLLAVDIKTQDTIDIEINDLSKYYDFFLPWAGMEKAQHQIENPADVKAAERMAKLFDEIKKDNPNESSEFIHSLNVFLSRLLFCFFSDDTNIFLKNQFINAISSHTQEDGSDLNIYLDKLFEVLNTEKNKRKNIPAYLDTFPYVNGGLFRDKYQSPIFTKRSRKVIIDSGELDWSAINPDIFGSMIQAVITPEHRGGLGMHYTSVPNIMKVIGPLFLDELYQEFEKAKGNTKKLDQLLDRLRKIKIFDPACGSGNFLIIAYKELRRLEMKIFKAMNSLALSNISLGSFYGIELDDFAHEITILSLWLAEHQMNVEFFKEFGKTNPTLPLKDAGHITRGNAAILSWEEVCPINEGDEIYILGNPPYLGYSLQSKEQKKDMAIAFKGYNKYKNLDYIACWFIKGANYIINQNAQFAFVTTNSICQGEQVASLWPLIINKNLQISFAHQPFKWTNNAKENAGVTCVIVGIRNIRNAPIKIFSKGFELCVENINPYLTPGKTFIITKRNRPLSDLPVILRGSGLVDGGHLILSDSERKNLIQTFPEAEKYTKKLIGASELIKGRKRWCLWIEDSEKEIALGVPEIALRINKIREFRLKSKKKATQLAAQYPHRFGEVRFNLSYSIMVPRVSSERRKYIPFGFLDGDYVISDAAQAIYNAEPWVFGIISSEIHMTWIRAVCGSLESRIRYSSALGYNTFPLLQLSKTQKESISMHVFLVLQEREKHPEKTLAQLYDQNKMPEGLMEAHRQLDLVVERCYRSKPFESDEERLEYLFKLYGQMITNEKTKDTLFAEQNKTRRKRK